MACSHPLRAFRLGYNENGTQKLKITSYNTHYVMYHGEKIYDSIRIPCGKCLSCKLNYARQWSIRCMLESGFYEHNYFLTITYDDEHNPRTLIKDDFRQFIKSLRTKLERAGRPPIRFFLCGEYGSKTLRPHAHAIIFGLELDDLQFLKTSKSGFDLYQSKFLDDVWKKGYIQVGECTVKSCGYVARYCLKGITHSMLEDMGLNPEFIIMSRRPGIGFGFFEKNKETIYNTDKIYFDFGDFSICDVPAYFDYLMMKLDPEIVSRFKDKRRLKADMNQAIEFMNSSLLHELDYLKLKEDQTEQKIKLLKERNVND